MLRSRSVTLLLIDGTATGSIQAKMDNWTGVGYRIPKEQLLAGYAHKDLKSSGVYFLLGTPEGDDPRPSAYIGQVMERKNGESVLLRFAEHQKSGKKAFTETVVFFTTSAHDLGATELCYLEHRFWQIAKEAGRYRLVNDKEPSRGYVSEAKEAELERFIENARAVMTFFGAPLFEKRGEVVASAPVSRAKKGKAGEKPTPLMRSRKTAKAQGLKLFLSRSTRNGISLEASAEKIGEEIVLKQGSHVLLTAKPSLPSAIRARRERDLAAGVLRPLDADRAQLTVDLALSSPSTASAYVLGRSDDGRLSWKTENGVPLGDLLAGKAPSPSSTSAKKGKGRFSVTLRRRVQGEDIVAHGFKVGQGIRVERGSLIILASRSGMPPTIAKLKEEHLASGVLRALDGLVAELTQAQTFTSASAAGSYVCGGAIDGRTQWKTSDGRTFGDLLQEETEAAETDK